MEQRQQTRGQAAVLQNFLSGVCACINYAIPLTLLISMNALFTDWLTSFDADRGRTTAVQATCCGITLGAGLIVGVLERKLGERKSLLMGTMLSAVGLFSGSLAPSLPALIFFVGVVTGCGFCLLHLSTLFTALRRFPERAAFLSSAMTVVASLFHLGTPLLYRLLSELYTWRGSLVMASAIVLHTAVFGLLLTSPVLHSLPPFPSTLDDANDMDTAVSSTAAIHFQQTKGDQGKVIVDTVDTVDDHQEQKQTRHTAVVSECYTGKVCAADNYRQEHGVRYRKNSDSDSNDGEGKHCNVEIQTEITISHGYSLLGENKPSCSLDNSASECTAFLPPIQACDDDQYVSSGQQSGRPTTERVLETNSDIKAGRSRLARVPASAAFLKAPLYLCILLSTVVSLSTILCFVLLVLDFALHNGWSVEDGVLLNVVYMLSGLIGRAVVGLISLDARVHSTALLIVSGLIGSAGLVFVGQVKSFWLSSVCYGTMGLGYGVMVGIFPPAVLDVTGPSTFPLALGLLCTVEGVLDAVMGIMTGVLVDVLHSYSMLSLVYGILSFITSILLLVVFVSRKRWRLQQIPATLV